MARVPGWLAGGTSSVYTTETGGLSRYPRLVGLSYHLALGGFLDNFLLHLGLE